jgi:hypothetical protein
MGGTDGWHRQELPVAEGLEVFNDIESVIQLPLLLLRNPGNKLPGPPANRKRPTSNDEIAAFRHFINR